MSNDDLEPVSARVDRAVVGWLVGETSIEATVDAVCRAIEISPVVCAVVEIRGGQITVLREPPETMLRGMAAPLAESLGVRRVLATPNDTTWRDLERHHVSIGSLAWIACEPVDEPMGVGLVVLGLENEGRDDVLARLPGIAKRLRAVLVEIARTDRDAKVVHRLNNLLAALSANLGYASELLGPPKTEPQLDDDPPSQRTDLAHAVKNAREAMTELRDMVGFVGKIVPNRRS
ncbi:MAG TPA: hypothetical protein VF407_12585 [Polyangiaceae bacterium]